MSDSGMRSQFMVMYKARDLLLYDQGNKEALKQTIMFETVMKEFLGRKVKPTPTLALNFVSRSLSKKLPIPF